MSGQETIWPTLNFSASSSHVPPAHGPKPTGPPSHGLVDAGRPRKSVEAFARISFGRLPAIVFKFGSMDAPSP